MIVKNTIKNIVILTGIMTTVLTVSYLFEIDSLSIITEAKPEWELKRKEKIDRLLAVPILLYHNIDGRGLYSISQKTLRQHFELMKNNNVKIIPLAELVARFDKPEPYKSKVAVITFDDGFLSMYTKVLPLAKEFKYPLTLFVYTDNIKISARKNLTWKMLRELEQNGISIQCHSKEHRDLDRLSRESSFLSRQKLYQEMYLSKRIIEQYLHKEVSFFAFPYGRYNAQLVDLAKETGYSRVFSTEFGSNIVTRNNYCLMRHHILQTYSLEMIKKRILYVF